MVDSGAVHAGHRKSATQRMNKMRTLLLATLSLTALAAHAQNSSGVRAADDVTLSGIEDPATEKVYIVQLASQSAAEFHARNSTAINTTRKITPGDSRPAKLQKNSAAIESYVAKLEEEQQSVLIKVGANTSRIYSYKYGLSGFASRMTVAQAQKLRSQPEVLNVWEDEIRPLATTDSASFLNLFDRDVGLRSARDLDGDGLVVAIIDSGVSPEHPALQDKREADRPRLCRSSWAESSLLGRWLCSRFDRRPDVVTFEPPEDWNGVCQSGERFADTDCNNKLIGARWFVDGAEATGPIDEDEFRSARDADGHGTHTATTAVGNRSSASIFGTLIGDVEGIAPKARLAVYKACWLRPGRTRASCNTSDLANAIDAAVADGVDVISYSIGSSMREVTAPDDVALMAATKAGVLAVVAAGNEGPGLGTIGSPAGGPWVITAAASSRTGESSVEALEVLTPTSIAGRIATREALFSPPLDERDPIEGELVLGDDGDDTLPNGDDGVTSDGCQPLVNGDEVNGKIVLLQRSGCLFTDMVRNAEDAGAVATLIYNLGGDPVVMFGESGLVDIPALMISQADGNLILAEFDDGNEVTVVLEKSLLLTSTDAGNVMATFSARGPAPVADVLKPDVTAPGINIIAGFTPDPANATPGENFAYLSGTSMSTPHVAGVALLLRQEYPGWSPAAIKSALMTTARRDVQIPDSLTPANPFDFGSGHIEPNAAFDPGLVYDANGDEYDAFACGVASPAISNARCQELAASGLSFDPKALNQPSIALSRLANQATVTRRVTNVTDQAETYSVSVATPPGINVSINPATLSVPPGGSAEFDVTAVYVSGPLDLWRFGSLTWSSSDHDVYSPIAIKPTSISAPAEVTAVGGSGSLTFPVEFGYNGAYLPRVHGLNLPVVQERSVDRDPTKTFTRRVGNGVTEHVFQVAANQLFLRFSLFDALTDGSDDLDLYVYYCGLDGSACTRIGESGSSTSQEQFNLFRPAAGIYGVYVHGFETDQVTGGPGAVYQLLAWSLGEVNDQGNMTASGPALVNAGMTSDISVDWNNLLPNTIYLGGISHNTPQGVSGLTIVTVGN